ncbi:MAG: CotH kinase family protein, partial [bacterium]
PVVPPTPNMENTAASAIALDDQSASRRRGNLYISEVMALPTDEKSDWVEIHNGTGVDVDLSGYGLSDQPGKPRRWQFPQGTMLRAGERVAVFLVGDGAAASGYLSAPFALSGQGGEAVCLCDQQGKVLDTLYLPAQYHGVSYGRDANGQCGYFENSTPLAANGTALKPPAQGVRYSERGGLHRGGELLSVTLTAPEGGRIYYTLDCTDPDRTKTPYTGAPIQVTGTTILRTRVYKDGCLPSIMDTQSYLYDVNAASEAPYVVSLVSDPVGLYSDETGIMVPGPNAEAKFPYGDYNRGANFWMEWEREAHVEVFTGSGQTAISQECGIKLHGRNTRAYELKCFKVMAKPCYGASRFRYPIFRERPWDEYEAFILRYTGQDYKSAFMRDVVMTNQAKHTSVMYMESEECIVYLNGKYYSAMYIRENISPFSLARREGWAGQEGALDLVKSGYEEKQGSNASYIALKAFLDSHDNASQEVYDTIAANVDIDNFIEFITMQVVYGPPDTVNVKRYRNPNADGKWRWVIYDLDRALRGGKDSIDGFELMAQGTNAQLFKAFMTNPTLRDRFLDYLNQALSTFLSSQSLADAANAQLARVSPLLPDYLNMMGISEK